MESTSLFRKLVSRFGVEVCVIPLLVLSFFMLQKMDFQHFEASGNLKSIYSVLDKVEVAVSKAEIAERDFLKYKKENDLNTYNENVRQINFQMGMLNRLAQKDPELRLRASQLNKTLHGHFEAVNETLNKRQKGLLNARTPASASVVADVRGSFSEISEISLFEIYKEYLVWGVIVLLAFGVLLNRFFEKRDRQKLTSKSQTLNQKSILLDTILNSMTDALIVTDHNGYFTHYNAAAQRIIGTKLKEMASELSATDLGFHEPSKSKRLTLQELPFHKTLHGDHWDEVELFVLNETHPSGTYISLSSRSLTDTRGRIVGSLVVFRDTSQRKEIEFEWARAREAAVEASLKKSDFLAAMSHEIRTPMNGVLGMTTLLADTPLSTEQSEYVGVVKRSAESLLMLINDILDYSKIEAGKVQLLNKDFDLKFVCRDILEIFKPLVAEKNIDIRAEFLGTKDWYFLGDSGRIRQILMNLIGNAVKFTELGSVTLTVTQARGLTGEVKLRFEVTDTGPGLKEDDRQELFKKYFQTKNGMKVGGTGLGLSISKQLVNLMDGDIGVESVVGLGSTFWFSIDLPPSESSVVLREQEVKFSKTFKGHVLLVEDQLVNQKVAEAYLRKLGLEVSIASNGLVACDKAREKEFDLIFMDCQMPILNGFDATRKIRKDGGSKVPIIALTAESVGGSEYLEAGMNDYLSKPLELKELVAKLRHWLPSARTDELDVSALEKLKDLVIKDQNLISTLIDDLEVTAPALIASMYLGLTNSDKEMICQSAHALKSASATLGAIKLSELCETLELVASVTEAERILPLLEKQYLKSLSELKSYHLQQHAS